MALLDLPPELIWLVAQHIGGPELRTSVSYLLVAKAWYWAALLVYLAGLQLSTLYLSAYDLERIPFVDTASGRLLGTSVEHLSLRLGGYPSKQNAIGSALYDMYGTGGFPW